MAKTKIARDVFRLLPGLGFEELVAAIKAAVEHGEFFVYAGEPFCTGARAYIRDRRHESGYGVYVVRREQSPPPTDDFIELVQYGEPSDVLYVGKGGTFSQATGWFKADGVLDRLTNPRDAIEAGSRERVHADIWFDRLASAHGTLRVEYMTWDVSKGTPRMLLTPALVEALLLQAHLNDFRRLPLENRAF